MLVLEKNTWTYSPDSWSNVLGRKLKNAIESQTHRFRPPDDSSRATESYEGGTDATSVSTSQYDEDEDGGHGVGEERDDKYRVLTTAESSRRRRPQSSSRRRKKGVSFAKIREEEAADDDGGLGDLGSNSTGAKERRTRPKQKCVYKESHLPELDDYDSVLRQKQRILGVGGGSPTSACCEKDKRSSSTASSSWVPPGEDDEDTSTLDKTRISITSIRVPNRANGNGGDSPPPARRNNTNSGNNNAGRPKSPLRLMSRRSRSKSPVRRRRSFGVRFADDEQEQDQQQPKYNVKKNRSSILRLRPSFS